ncbi:MAG TPA: GTPase Era, partial [Microscillaceae bacterium]|nr:GTPase Era [Microscillaceae bacterium]
LNKVDLLNQAEAQKIWESWQQTNLFKSIFVVSALEKFNLGGILSTLVDCLPVHPPFFPKDDLSDQSERFFAAEIIREKIFLNYEQEIPYCSEVIVTEFKESEKIIHIRAEILVERDSQKGILIGKGGAALKKTGTDARKSLEEFFQKQVFLEQYVKVIGEWRKQPKLLRRLGYE